MTSASCGSCGRPLRDPVSRAAGLGPVCRRNLRPAVPTAGTAELVRTPHAPGPGQTELPLNPHQPTLWSL